MKIDEATINHNAVRLVKGMAYEAWETSDIEHFPQMQIAYVNGVMELAEELKKVLRE